MGDVDALAEEIGVQGQKVKDLKTAKAGKDEIDNEVGKLLALKQKITELDPSHALAIVEKKKKGKKPQEVMDKEETDETGSKNAAKKAAKKEAKKAKKEQHKQEKPSTEMTTTEGPVIYCCAKDAAVCSRWAATGYSFVMGDEQQPWTIIENTKIFGDLAIARTMAPALQGVQKALVDQWCDFSLSYPAVGDVATFLGLVDSQLTTSTYLTGPDLTLADIAVFAALRRVGALDKTPQNVQRWLKLMPTIDLTNAQAGAPPKPPKEEEQDSCPPLDGGIDGKVVTRFPPEPSGYLHIGHAKALLLNDYYARRYSGKLIVRFDDTNPSKEKGEYAENILKDVDTLLGGFGNYVTVTHTSDHFEKIKKFAVQLIEQGDAFVDDTPQEEMRKERDERTNSKRRDTSVAENLKLFDEICSGKLQGSCLRAKIDMQSVNGTLRDPVIFRTNSTPHHKTGTKYKAYPTYDLACPIVDSLEGVTHALRTTEYNDRDAQYEWIQTKLKIRPVKIHAFSRINFVRTLMSKRKLAWLVDENVVDGWNDPRFPTIQGVKRRGVSMASLREFIVSQGASRNIINMEWDSFWAINKAAYEPLAPRFQAVEKHKVAKLQLSNVPEFSKVSAITVQLHPKDPGMGCRAMRVSNTVLLENEDAESINVGDERVLMRWGVVTITSKNEEDGNILLTGTFDKDATKLKKKPIHFLADVSELADIDLVEYDYLISKPKLEEDDDLQTALTPVSKVVTPAFGDPGLTSLKYGDVVQLERRGFYICDQAAGFNGEKTLRLILIPDGKAKMPFSRLPSAIQK